MKKPTIATALKSKKKSTEVLKKDNKMKEKTDTLKPHDAKKDGKSGKKRQLMRNMKISVKLLTGFCIVVFFAMVIGLVGISGMRRLSEADAAMYTDSVVPIKDYGNAALSYEQARVSAMNVVLAAQNNDMRKAESESGNYNTSMEDFLLHFNEAGQKAYSEEEKALYEESLDLFDKYFKPSFDKVVKFALAGGNASNELTIAFAMTEKLGENIKSLFEMNVNSANSTQMENTGLANRLTTALFLVMAGSVLIGILLAFYIRNLIVRPINQLMHSASEIRKGNLDVEVDTEGKDEVAKLARYFATVVSTLKSVISGIKLMSDDHVVGKMDSRIDEKDYQGAYKEVVLGVNNMIGNYVDILHDIFAVLQGFGNGDFSVPFKQLPGEQAIANANIEHVRKNLNDINQEITRLAESAVNGKLSARTNAKYFEGDWANLLVGLNMVMDAIVQPINETMEALENIAEGELSVKVYGDYKGDFEKMKTSVNKTVDNLNLYISEISRVLRALANNNFDQQITREYVGDFIEIKHSLNRIIDKLNAVMKNITTSTLQVASGAKQISDSSMILAEGATQQTTTVEGLTSSVSMVNEQTQNNAESADNANRLAEESKASAQNGNLEMQNMLGAMDSIKDSSNNISNIIKVIDDIAFQTNLLALNAAVEAARAGDHGKGFAVVAEEVRNLAARSQKAAKETSTMIEDSINRVDQGTRIAKETSLALDKIVSDATVLSDIISNIAVASREQADSIKGITSGLDSISEVVQSNSATAEQSAALAEQLTGQSDTLSGILATFVLKNNQKKS